MTEQVDVLFKSGSESGDDVSQSDMDSFFEQSKQDELNPSKEIDHEDGERLREQPSADESNESSEREGDDAESSDEDGREEHPDNEVQPDEGKQPNERHQQSYKIALKEERQRRQEVQQELADAREASKKMTEAFNKLVEAADKPTAQQPQIPDYEEDPIGHLNAKLEMANQKIEGLSKSDQQSQQAQIEQNNMKRFMGDYNEQSREFESENPDYGDAYKHLVGEIRDDYMAQGLTKRQAIDAANNDEMMLAAQQMTNKMNPAKVIYEMAKRRGYRAEGKSQSQVKPNAIDKMERLERGVKASRSINNKGVSPNDRMTLEEIAELDDGDFDKLDWNRVLNMG